MEKAANLFFTLLRQGLWGKPEDAVFADIQVQDWQRVLDLATQQTVVGILADGLDVKTPVKVPADVAMKLVMAKISIERRNYHINDKIEELISLFMSASIPAVIVKGQMIAKCYRNPSSRMPGDIDIVVRSKDYTAAKEILTGISKQEGEEIPNRLHFSAFSGEINVEIHGTIHTCLSRKINELLDRMQNDLFSENSIRRGYSEDFDVLYVFIHLLQHFYCGGIGLRQLCDMSMALHRYKGHYDEKQLQERLMGAGIIQEWKVFMSFLVNYLGLPKEDAFLYESSFDAKTEKLWEFIRKAGNFGNNKKKRKYTKDSNFLLRKAESFFRGASDFFQHISLFPLNSIKFFSYFTFTGICAASRGE